MNQILQSLKTGDTVLADIPCPGVGQGQLLIQTKVSVVSVGTERMLVNFGKSNLLGKVRQQPDKVRQVLDKIKTDGIKPTLQAVRAKLDQPLPLGYSNVGVVQAIGKGVTGFSVGDRVVSNGPHAQVVNVPQNLCSKIHDTVSDEQAAFTVIASVALQGVRLASPNFGESFVVTGLGLIGLITVQILKAQGCRVLGIDFDPAKLRIAQSFGAEVVDLSKGENPIEFANLFSKGRGVDGVLITASTNSSEPVHQAALMCRKRGRIVLVGVAGLQLSRADFYEKELSFQVSCSYGPGRYDSLYEEKGQDYPIGFVRWTEQRNFEAILDMLSEKRLDFSRLITHHFSIEQAVDAYSVLSEGKPSLGILLHYGTENHIETVLTKRTVDLNETRSTQNYVSKQNVSVAVIGAGNFTNQMLMPAIKETGVFLKSICSSGGVTGVHVGNRYGFMQATTNSLEIINDREIDAVFITTRHNTHAEYVKNALINGKHVFVEKPLCLTREELVEIQQTPLSRGQILMVGFNRRFSPHAKTMKTLMDSVAEPKTMVMTVNAGYIPEDHWTQDLLVGGGRVLGEACHFVDLMRYLIGYPIIDVTVRTIGKVPGIKITQDKITFTLTFADGSIGTVHYFSNGHKSFPKEKLDVFAGGKVLELNNFKTLTGYGWSKFKKQKLWNQDKGHSSEVKAFVEAVRNGKSCPIPLDETYEVTKTCLDIIESIK